MTKTARDIVNQLLGHDDSEDHDDCKREADQALKELEAIISRQVIGHTQYPDQSEDVTYDMYIESTLQAKQRRRLRTALYGRETEL